MRIACVIPYVPNLIRTRPYNLILGLLSLGHEVEVFTLGSGRQDLLDAEALRAKGARVQYFVQPAWRSLWNSAMALASQAPLQSVYSWQAGMARSLATEAAEKRFDVVHVEHLRGSRYGEYLKSRLPAFPVVWDSVDCISHLFRQSAGQGSGFIGSAIRRLELPRTRRAEARLIRCFDHALVTSSADRDALLSLLPGGQAAKPITVLPNGVDLEYFHPNPAVAREPATVVFSGKMSYHANVAMAKYLVAQIMPLVWAARPETCLYIVGKDPPPEIRQFAQDPRVQVTGTVDDIRPYLWRSTLSIVPLLYGAGIQNKILEAMATGTPVVTSPRTLSALQVLPGQDLLTAEDPQEFARGVLRLIDDPALRHSVGEAGLEYVRREHDWNCIAARLVDIYRQAAGSSQAA